MKPHITLKDRLWVQNTDDRWVSMLEDVRYSLRSAYQLDWRDVALAVTFVMWLVLVTLLTLWTMNVNVDVAVTSSGVILHGDTRGVITHIMVIPDSEPPDNGVYITLRGDNLTYKLTPQQAKGLKVGMLVDLHYTAPQGTVETVTSVKVLSHE